LFENTFIYLNKHPSINILKQEINNTNLTL
jgi:hypothetical protein